MLYLVATPIGNLADITYRAVTILQKCAYILCEDTRYSKRLLSTYSIDRPLKSYHKFNEQQRQASILDDLRQGQEIALISDAGTPGICDPGGRLVASCIENNLPFTVIPGANAALTALCLSGLSTERFQFFGFLPKTEGKCQQIVEEILDYLGTTILYETPHRLLKTLRLIEQIDPTREIVVTRELTKLHEECRRGTVKDLLQYFHDHPPRGEIVLLIRGGNQKTSSQDWPPLEEHVNAIQKQFNLSLSDAIKKTARLRGIPKRDLYRIVHALEISN